MVQRLLFALLVFTAAACAQVTSSSVTVTASRSTNLQPDLVVITVGVTTPLTGTRDDAVNALGGSGITVANFIGVYTNTLYPSGTNTPLNVLQWNFSLTAPIADFKTTVGLLTTVASGVAKKNNGISVSFSIQGTQVSAQLAQSQPCPIAGLISDARTQAQTLASAAGVTLGGILAMSSPGSTTSACLLTVKFSAFPL
jgi:uncharacterized protein YggE